MVLKRTSAGYEKVLDGGPTGQNLKAIVRLGDEAAIAVGAGGTIIER